MRHPVLRRFLQKSAALILDVLQHLANEHRTAMLRARIGHIGAGGTLGTDLTITAPHRLWLGDNVHIGRHAWIRAEGGLKIGSHTHISRNVTIYTINHDYQGVRLPYDETLVQKPVTIGENVWIGMNVSIAPGTDIGDGAIIAMGACVSGKVPPLAIVGHQKWRVIGQRDPIHYRKLVESGAFGGADGIPFSPE